MPSERQFTVMLWPEPEGGFTVRVPAFPEIVTYGLDRDDALANAREALELALEDYRDDGRELPRDVAGHVEHLTVAA